MLLRYQVPGALILALVVAACGGGENASSSSTHAGSMAAEERPGTEEALDTSVDLGPEGKEVAMAAASFYASRPIRVTVTGSGTVTSSPAGISCGPTGGDCSEAYTKLTRVVLSATPVENGSFIGWSGACSGSGPTCEVYNSQTRTITAMFSTVTTPSHALSVTVSGSGTVLSNPAGIHCGTGNATCQASYAAGTSVTLNAQPASGYTLQNWGGACLGAGVCTTTLSQARSVTATFVATGGDTTTTPPPSTGGGSSSDGGTSSGAPAVKATTARDAVRLADQGSFGPSEALVAEIRTKGSARWIYDQMSATKSRYVSGGNATVHQYTGSGNFCDDKGSNCWRDWSSSTPVLWDFYRNAVSNPDQLRQRVAFALQQIAVVSNLEVDGTYGFRYYYNTLLDEAFGNYRTVLKKVALSPLMGSYLNNANNDKNAPNENFARELLQLFAIGTCELNADGSLKGGACRPTYDNERVRSYAFALTGWTYPAGGATPWGCWPKGTNCRFYQGDMVGLTAFHDSQARTLLSGVTLNAGHTPAQALESVLDSLMRHPNTAPFISKQLIQHLVTSNPSPAYVQRVAAAFSSGRYQSFGKGQAGDLAATVAAILLDSEARTETVSNTAGKLREPTLMFTGVLRSLNGVSDGDALGWWWGDTMRQHVFMPPSVFNFYPPDYPVPGTSLVGPAFGIHNANTGLQRLNYVNYLVVWSGSSPSASVPNAVGTRVNLVPFEADAADPAKLVDRLSMVAYGQALPPSVRSQIITAVTAFNEKTDRTNYLKNRVKSAAYLVFTAPQYHVIR